MNISNEDCHTEVSLEKQATWRRCQTRAKTQPFPSAGKTQPFPSAGKTQQLVNPENIQPALGTTRKYNSCLARENAKRQIVPG